MQRAVRDAERRVRRDDIDVVCLHLRAIGDFDDRHPGVGPQQFDHRALVVGVEVRHQHERHAAVGRRFREEALEGVEPARRGTDTHDRARRLRKRWLAPGARFRGLGPLRDLDAFCRFGSSRLWLWGAGHEKRCPGA